MLRILCLLGWHEVYQPLAVVDECKRKGCKWRRFRRMDWSGKL